VRILTPNNHGEGAWSFLSNFGGGLVDGDRLDVDVEVGRDAMALLGTQGFTKVYRSRPGSHFPCSPCSPSQAHPHASGCSQHLVARVGDAATLVMVPDPVVCFAGARYTQRIDVDLAPSASLLLLDGYTCGRGARGERWQFSRYASRTTVRRGGAPVLIDATRLDPAEGPIGARMGRFGAVLSLVALGPRLGPVREAMLAPGLASGCGSAIVAASPLAQDGGILRVFAESFEGASHALRSSFVEVARLLGDDPIARKW
jgi:urease accessory protein